MIFNPKLHIAIFFIFLRCKSGIRPFFVSGAFATIEEFPHSVYLAADCSLQWICGAAILNQQILLTAAHCIKACNVHNEKHLIEAFVGHEILSKVKSSKQIGDMIIHENYDEQTYANDIALAALKTSLQLGQNIKRILIRPHFPKVQFGQIAGWEIKNNETKDAGLKLMILKQKIRPKSVCAKIGILDAGMFCAGSTKNEGHYPADGDSGSALVTKDRNTALGLVSFRSRKVPALTVYMNVSHYYKWITRNAQKLYCKTFDKF